jgi:hypothetical protein
MPEFKCAKCIYFSYFKRPIRNKIKESKIILNKNAHLQSTSYSKLSKGMKHSLRLVMKLTNRVRNNALTISQKEKAPLILQKEHVSFSFNNLGYISAGYSQSR